VPGRMEGLAVSLQALPLRPEPTRDRLAAHDAGLSLWQSVQALLV
jgi:hypothetical protein